VIRPLTTAVPPAHRTIAIEIPPRSDSDGHIVDMIRIMPRFFSM
jgi:hypothetical protein